MRVVIYYSDDAEKREAHVLEAVIADFVESGIELQFEQGNQ